jgi:sialate O-acetylesterase
VPIGIINSSVGGTPIESWTSEEGLKEFPQLKSRVEKLRDTAYLNPMLRSTRRKSDTGQNPPANSKPMDKGISGPIPWCDINYHILGNFV